MKLLLNGNFVRRDIFILEYEQANSTGNQRIS